MVGYILRRLLSAIPVLLGVSILVFAFVHLIPGDPATAILGERATPERLEQVRTTLGLDKPMWEQYGIYMGKVLRGDFGTSIFRGDSITKELLTRFPATLELALTALLIAVVFGVPAGVFSAVRRNSLLDNGTMLVVAHRRLDAYFLARADDADPFQRYPALVSDERARIAHADIQLRSRTSCSSTR